MSTFLSSFRLVPHNVSGILATFWLTMWLECEEFVSLNEDAYSFTLYVKSTFEDSKVSYLIVTKGLPIAITQVLRIS